MAFFDFYKNIHIFIGLQINYIQSVYYLSYLTQHNTNYPFNRICKSFYSKPMDYKSTGTKPLPYPYCIIPQNTRWSKSKHYRVYFDFLPHIFQISRKGNIY